MLELYRAARDLVSFTSCAEKAMDLLDRLGRVRPVPTPPRMTRRSTTALAMGW